MIWKILYLKESLARELLRFTILTLFVLHLLMNKKWERDRSHCDIHTCHSFLELVTSCFPKAKQPTKQNNEMLRQTYWGDVIICKKRKPSWLPWVFLPPAEQSVYSNPYNDDEDDNADFICKRIRCCYPRSEKWTQNWPSEKVRQLPSSRIQQYKVSTHEAHCTIPCHSKALPIVNKICFTFIARLSV